MNKSKVGLLPNIHLKIIDAFSKKNYTNLHQYMSLIDILKHAVEHNTLNNTHTLQHRQVQVVVWPHWRCTLE